MEVSTIVTVSKKKRVVADPRVFGVDGARGTVHVGCAVVGVSAGW